MLLLRRCEGKELIGTRKKMGKFIKRRDGIRKLLPQKMWQTWQKII